MQHSLIRNSVGKLFVTVIEAADLLASDPNGKSDPFCVVKLGDAQEQATKVINNTLNPRWNQTVSEESASLSDHTSSFLSWQMDFVVTDLDNSTLEVTVFDRDLFSPNGE